MLIINDNVKQETVRKNFFFEIVYCKKKICWYNLPRTLIKFFFLTDKIYKALRLPIVKFNAFPSTLYCKLIIINKI